MRVQPISPIFPINKLGKRDYYLLDYRSTKSSKTVTTYSIDGDILCLSEEALVYSRNKRIEELKK